jgi:hypothetical protein
MANRWYCTSPGGLMKRANPEIVALLRNFAEGETATPSATWIS